MKFYKRSRKSYTGGNAILGSQPFKSFGFEHGASSAREAALLHEKNNNDMQQQLNRQSGGSIEVPTFPPIGGIKQAYSSSDLSIGGNTNLINGLNDAQSDCFATDTCKPTIGGSRRRRNKRRKTRKTRRYRKTRRHRKTRRS